MTSSFLFAGDNISTNEIDSMKVTDAPKMWNAYHAKNLGETIPNGINSVDRYDIGLTIDADDFPDKSIYIIGLEVENIVNMPQNIITRVIPKADYAVFSTLPANTHTFVKNIHRTWDFIYRQWLPDSGYMHSGTYQFETYCENSRTYSEDIYIPIQKYKGEDNDKLAFRYLNCNLCKPSPSYIFHNG